MKAWQLITIGAIGLIVLWVVWTIREQFEAYAKGLTDILAEAKKSTSELSAGLVQPVPSPYQAETATPYISPVITSPSYKPLYSAQPIAYIQGQPVYGP